MNFEQFESKKRGKFEFDKTPFDRKLENVKIIWDTIWTFSLIGLAGYGIYWLIYIVLTMIGHFVHPVFID